MLLSYAIRAVIVVILYRFNRRRYQRYVQGKIHGAFAEGLGKIFGAFVYRRWHRLPAGWGKQRRRCLRVGTVRLGRRDGCRTGRYSPPSTNTD